MPSKHGNNYQGQPNVRRRGPNGRFIRDPALPPIPPVPKPESQPAQPNINGMMHIPGIQNSMMRAMGPTDFMNFARAGRQAWYDMAKLTHISQPPGHEHEQHPGNTVLYKIHHPEIPDCGVELHAWQRTLPGHYSPTAEDKRVYPSIRGEEKEIRWCTRFPRSGNNPEPNRPIMEHGPYCYLCTRLNETSIDRIVETKRLPFCHRCKQELERRFPSGYRSCKCAVEWKLNCCTACMRTEVRHEYNRLAFPDGRVIAKRWRRAFGEVRMMRPKYLTDRQRSDEGFCPCGAKLHEIARKPQFRHHYAAIIGADGHIWQNLYGNANRWPSMCGACSGIFVACTTRPMPLERVPRCSEPALPWAVCFEDGL